MLMSLKLSDCPLHNRSILRNALEDDLIKPKHVVHRDYICYKEGVLTVLFHTHTHTHIYIYLFTTHYTPGCNP
jgi:hypothetical protein